MSTFTLELPTGQQQDTSSWAAVAFIASYSSEATRRTYTTQLRLWMAWCADHHLDPLADIRRPHVELYARELEARGLSAATVALKLVENVFDNTGSGAAGVLREVLRLRGVDVNGGSHDVSTTDTRPHVPL
jgi:hypothetical protein